MDVIYVKMCLVDPEYGELYWLLIAVDIAVDASEIGVYACL